MSVLGTQCIVCSLTHDNATLRPQNNAELDSGDKTIQCGRKADQCKLWFMWKAWGDAGLARRVERCIELVNYMANKLQVRLRACVLG